MSTPTTLAAKKQAVTENETRLLAAIQSNRSQAKTLDDQYKQLEEQRHVFAGAKLILDELLGEVKDECSEPCDCAPPDNVAPIANG